MIFILENNYKRKSRTYSRATDLISTGALLIFFMQKINLNRLEVPTFHVTPAILIFTTVSYYFFNIL